MALSAVFSANFRAFIDECAKSELALKNFSEGGAKTEAAMNRVGNSLSGVRIVQEATIAAAAVEKLGGVSGLTDKELKRIGATAQEASDKLRKMGQDVPPGIQKIADAAKNASKETGLFDSTIGKLAAAFSISHQVDRVVDSLIGFGKAAFTTADHLTGLSAKTGLSLTALQKMAFVAANSGTTVDAFADTVFKLGINIQKGGKDVEAAVVRMGLSFADFKTQAPEEQFNLIVENLDKLGTGGQRNAALVALFGKSVGDTIPGLIDNYQELAKQANIASDEQIAALKKAGDAWTNFVTRAQNEVTIFLGSVVADTERGLTMIGRAWDDFRSFQARGFQGHRDYMAGLQAQLAAEAQAKVAKEALTKALREQGDANAAAAETTKVAKVAFDAYGKSVSDLAAQFTGKKLDQEIQKIADAVTKAGGAQKITTFEGEKLTKQLRDLESQGAKLPPMLNAVIARFDAWGAAGIRTQAGLGSILKLLPSVTKAVEDDALAWLKLQTALKEDASWAKLFGSLAGLEKGLAGVITTAQQTTKVDLKGWGEEGTKSTDGLGRSLADLAASFVQLAQIGGESFGAIAKAAGIVTVAFDGMSKGAKAFEDASKKHDFGGMAAGTLQQATAVFTLASAINSYLDAMNKANRVEADQARGRDILNKAFASQGVPRGAVVERPADFSDDLNAKVNKDFERAIALAKRGAGELQRAADEAAARAQAVALNLSGAIAEMGGLTSKNLAEMEAKALPLFDLIAKHGKIGLDAQRELNTLVGQFGAAADKAGGIWDTALQLIIAKAKEAGLELSGITDLIAGQQSKLASGAVGVTAAIGKQADTFAALTKDLKAALAAGDNDKAVKTQEALAKAAVTTQGEFDRLSRIELAAFNTLVSSGVGTVDAMSQVGVGIDNLVKNADAFGLAGNQAFEELKRWRDLTTINEDLLSQVGSLNDLLVASANLGGLTADGFADLQAQGESAFAKLTEAHFSENEALVQMKPFLETVIKLHKDKGFAIDEATQKLIDQAKEQGILAEAEASTQDVLREGLGEIIKILGGDLPDAWKKMADSAKEAVDKATGKDGLGKVTGSLAVVDKALADPKDWEIWKKHAEEAAASAQLAFKNLDLKATVDFSYNIPDLPSFPGQDTHGAPFIEGFNVDRELHGASAPVFPQAAGGDYMVTKPTLFLAGEKGPERATFSGAGKTGGSGGAPVTIAIDMRGAYLPDRESLRDFANKILPLVAEQAQRHGLTRPR